MASGCKGILIIKTRNPRNDVPKFQAEFGVTEEEPDGPREWLARRLSERCRHHIPRPQYVGADRAHREGTPVNVNLYYFDLLNHHL